MACVNALKQWTGLPNVSILYDSDVDTFTDSGFFEKVKNKQNVAIIACTTDGDVFGGFYTVAATGPWEYFFDPNMFIFSFESHGRCMTPQRFTVKWFFQKEAFVRFCKNDKKDGWFVWFGVDRCYFSLGNERSTTYCCELSIAFEGIQDKTLTGSSVYPNFVCTRLLAVQLC